MYLPEGMNENEVLRIIDKAIKNLAQNLKFGYYEVEDMMQEGRIFAMEALPKYDPNRDCSLEQFIRVVVRNKFISLRRDKMERIEPPCHSCPHFIPVVDGVLRAQCTTYENKNDCERWFGWVERNTAKRILTETYDNDESPAYHPMDFSDLSDSLISQEIIALMDRKIPLSMKADYRRYLENVRLPKHRRLKVEEEIKRIVSEYYELSEKERGREEKTRGDECR